MSPTKPSPPSAQRHAAAHSAVSSSSNNSSIPISRRAKPTSARLRKPTFDPKKELEMLVFNDSTVASTSHPVNLFSKHDKNGANKENLPILRSRNLGSNGGGSGTSPTRGKTSITKPTKSSPTKRLMRTRVPLRELSDAEIFERDTAVLGDLRRRRSGGHDHFDVDSILAHPDESTANSIRASSVSSSATGTSGSTTSTAPTEPDNDNDDGTFRVLRRTDSEESLRLKIESIVASTSGCAKNDESSVPKFAVTSKATKLKYPVAKPATALSSGSPVKKVSPVIGRRGMSPIVKSSPSPLKARVGLGIKSANTLMKTTDGKKKVFVSSSSTTAKKMVVQKSASNSLRRAAGTRTGSAGVTSLEGIKRLR